MKRQLLARHRFKTALHQQREGQQNPNYQRLIADFKANAKWVYPTRLQNRDGIEPILVMSTQTGGRIPCTWYDQAEAAHHFVGLYGDNWREHIVAKRPIMPQF